ncbi:MAG: BglII/BstYI family type II restriction endonuclease [Verrucomicrobiota bacterium]
MKVGGVYSHLNGEEYVRVHRPDLWGELAAVIEAIDAEKCRTKVSQEKDKVGEVLYSPVALNDAFKVELGKRGWEESRVSYWVTGDEELARRTASLPPEEQKREIEAAGEEAIYSYNQTDFLKERVAIEVQFGKYSFVAYDLFVKHPAFYVGNEIDVGVEILPVKALQSQMSSGVAYYEGELYNLIRQGRGVPPVPLIVIGIDA